ncbi:MAG: hypothetical protein ACKO2P_07250 [Planctomycetota bacterium]
MNTHVSLTLPLALLLTTASLQAQDTSSTATSPTPDRPTVIVVVGAPGTEDYGTAFQQWAERWQKAASSGAADFTWIGPGTGPSNTGATTAPGPATPATPAPATSSTSLPPATTASDRDLLSSAIQAASHAESSQPLWLIYIGHGTFDQQTAALNLRGPDLSAEELATLLKPLSRPLVVALCASGSAPFINALSGPGRVVISATKDGNQVQYSRFGDAFSTAIGGLDADVDRDGQTSLLEAWLFAARRTAEFYSTAGRLATEHSLLDDNGDSRGVRAELFEGLRPAPNVQSDQPVDGASAGKIWLVRSAEERQLTVDQQVTRDALEARLEALKARRSELDETDYLQQLEDILRPLAELYREAEQRPAEKSPAP